MKQKKINLEEVIDNICSVSEIQVNDYDVLSMRKIIIEFGKQLLELAAENAKMTLLVDEENDIIEEVNIDKQSILDTIKQIE